MRTFFFSMVFFLFFSAFSGWAESARLDVIVIDPGHGGYDTGIRPPGMKEKEITLALARQMKELLDSMDKDVVLTRKIDHYQTIDERRTIANRSNPDIFLSLHLSDSNTFAVYVMWYEKKDLDLSLREYYALSSRQRRYLYESGVLSADIAEALKEETEIEVFRREMPLPILGAIGSPAVLVEVPSDGIDYEEELEKVASYIVLGLMKYEQSR